MNVGHRPFAMLPIHQISDKSLDMHHMERKKEKEE
jgi:hypothetical protein